MTLTQRQTELFNAMQAYGHDVRMISMDGDLLVDEGTMAVEDFVALSETWDGNMGIDPLGDDPDPAHDIAAALDANCGAYFDGRLSRDDWSAMQSALWSAARNEGVADDVIALVDPLRRPYAF